VIARMHFDHSEQLRCQPTPRVVGMRVEMIDMTVGFEQDVSHRAVILVRGDEDHVTPADTFAVTLCARMTRSPGGDLVR